MRIVSLILVLLLAAIGPNIFPAALAGYSTMHILAIRLLLPSLFALAVLVVLVRKSQPDLSGVIVMGAVSGALATFSLEIVRLIGFHFGFMPGNLPRLMGVLLFDRFAEGPSLISDLAGWAYHLWNGAAFGIIYVILFGTKRRWVGAAYGVALGIGFMLSPVVTSLGVGFFGLQFSYGFPVTVLLAHIAFGWSLGLLAYKFLSARASLTVEEFHCWLSPSYAAKHAGGIR